MSDGADERSTGSKVWDRTRKYVPISIVTIVAGVIVVVWIMLSARTRDITPTEPPPVDVTVQVVQTRPEMPDTFFSHGVVEPNRMVRVAAEVSGQIKSPGRRKAEAKWLGRTFPAGGTIAEGEPISMGDEIVLLDKDLLQAEFDRAKAQADYDQREHKRVSELHRKNVATQTELDLAKTKMNVSKAAFIIAREHLERATIEAPIDGVLNSLPEEVGQYVQPGTCVAEIVDMSIAKIVVDVSERNIHHLSVGDPAQVIIDSLSAREVDGLITFISELADDKARTTRVEISIPNAERFLRSGQSVRVLLARQVLKNVIMIPLKAVIPLEDGRVTYVVVDGGAQRREVKLGMMKGKDVRVLEGLIQGDKLIVEGYRYVGPGQKVRIQEALSPATQPVKAPLKE